MRPVITSIRTPSAGYTLVEVLVYVALFAVISITVIQICVGMMRTAGTAAVNHLMQENGYTTMEGITRLIRGADAVTVAESTFDSNDSILTLEYRNSDNTVTTKKIYVSNVYYLNYWPVSTNVRAVQVDEDGVLQAPFTARNVAVDSLVFRRIQTPRSEAIKIELTITSRTRTPQTERFYNTVILRGTY